MKKLRKSAARVLVVDDNHLSLMLIANLVRREEVAEVVTAKSGSDALQKFPALKPDIVFLDIDMEDLDGFATLRAIKVLDQTAQVVMVSATATPSRVEAAREGGAAGFLVKPVSQKRIGDSILSCIKHASQKEGEAELTVISAD